MRTQIYEIFVNKHVETIEHIKMWPDIWKINFREN